MGNKDSKDGVPFSQIKNKIKPFDLILFKGSGIMSQGITTLQKLIIGNGDWSHVGVVITNDILNYDNVDSIYILESTLSATSKDVSTNKISSGVELRDLSQVINDYDSNPKTKIAWCPLINNPMDKKETESADEYNTKINKIKENIIKFYNEHSDAKYDYNCFSLGKSLFSWFKKPSHNPNMYFCSELVVSVYQELGLIDKNLDPETFTPTEIIDTELNLVKLPPIAITKDIQNIEDI